MAVISDMNGAYGSTLYRPEVSAAVEKVIALKPDLVLSTGDMVAGQRAGLDYAAMWSSFHRIVSDPIAQAQLSFAVTPGNHDASAFSEFVGERAMFQKSWRGRQEKSLEANSKSRCLDCSKFPFRYSLTVGDVLVLALDATRPGAFVVGSNPLLKIRNQKLKLLLGICRLEP
jgi:3',5'-cyclic AMP phosphodiesterase CpdA